MVRVKDWNERLEPLAEMLSQGVTVSKAAEILGVSERTIYLWKKRPEWPEIREEYYKRSSQELFYSHAYSAMEAVLTRLMELIHSDQDGIALGACRDIAKIFGLDYQTIRGVLDLELQERRARIKQLEGDDDLQEGIRIGGFLRQVFEAVDKE